MGYKSKYDPDEFREIEDILRQLQDLSPGERMTLDGFACVADQERTRW